MTIDFNKKENKVEYFHSNDNVQFGPAINKN